MFESNVRCHPSGVQFNYTTRAFSQLTFLITFNWEIILKTRPPALTVTSVTAHIPVVFEDSLE